MKKKLFSALTFALLSVAAANAQTTTWNLTGNAGTSPATNFLGTTDNNSLVLKANNMFSGLIDVTTNYNTAFGFNSFNSTTTGTGNSSFGVRSLSTNTTGVNNVAVGYLALAHNTTGTNNVGVGAGSLSTNQTGSYNIVMGTNSAMHATGLNSSVVIGFNALVYGTSGNYNTLVGDLAMGNLTSGSNNIAIGYTAGANLASTGSNNIFIVSNSSGPNITTDVSNQLNIGNWIYGNNGNIGIGTSVAHDAKLAVNGTVLAQEVTVDSNPADWPDYVFAKTYGLRSLTEVKSYIDKNQHLPELPSAEEVQKDGLKLGEMNKLLTKKVEELTLYMIDKDKQVKDLNSKLTAQQAEINKLTKMVEALVKK